MDKRILVLLGICSFLAVTTLTIRYIEVEKKKIKLEERKGNLGLNMKKKVFCINCKYLKKERDLGYYDSINFIGGIPNYQSSRIIDTTPICFVGLNDRILSKDNPIKKYTTIEYLVHNPLVLNIENNCKSYKRKFWKFLIKD